MRRRAMAGGFSFVEVLITIVLVGVAFMPMMQLFAVGMASMQEAKQYDTAVYYAEEEMERLALAGEDISVLRTAGPVERNPDAGWRVQRICKPETQPLEIRIKVFRQGYEKSIYELVTFKSELAR